MHPEMEMIKCSILRGGTSKAIFINKNELPNDAVMRDKVIRAIFGSPDLRQIDGLGGADVLTSKLAIIGPSTRHDADIDYTFGQVSFETEVIDYNGNCGNISSAVGPYAIDEGFVHIKEPITTVRIHLTNSGRILIAEVPVIDGKASVEGDCIIDGVPGSGAKITLDWSGTVGSVCGKLLPTGNAQDVINADGVSYPVSMVDVGNPLVFIKASSLGLSGTETPIEIETNKKLMGTIEKIRSQAAVIFGLVDKSEDAKEKSPYNPFFAIISPPADYYGLSKKSILARDIDIVSRLIFMLKAHKAYPVTGTACTGAAFKIPGSIVYETINEQVRKSNLLRIGQPAGVIPVEVETHIENGQVQYDRIGVYRTARRIMDGYVYIKKSVFEKEGYKGAF